MVWTGKAFANEAFTVQTQKVDIDALGHDWDNPTYEWAEDNKTVTATHVCKRNESHKESEDAEATGEITKPATCTEKGETTWTSKAFANEAFEVQTKKADIGALGHDWGEPVYTWAEDNRTVTATHVCKRDGEHTESEDADVTGEQTKAPTCAEKGETTYTSAAFANKAFTVQKKTEPDIDQLPHTEEVIPGQEPTYFATGLTEGVKCSVCGTVIIAQEVIEKLRLYAGEGLTCDLTEAGVLTISGKGAIEEDALTGTGSELIKKVIIEEGITAIGKNAFAGCTNLTEATIPESVTKIGEGAFAGCSQLIIHCYAGSMAETFAKTQDIGVSLLTKPVTKVTLNATKKTLTRTGKALKPTLTLKATVLPTDATDTAVTWKSSNPKIATVDKNGKVTALKAGSVTITCEAHDGSGKKATCTITVVDTKVKSIKLSKSKASVKAGKTLTLTVKFTPVSPVNQQVTWKSSNKKIATVNTSGKVTVNKKAQKGATVTITCTSKDGRKTASCKITVK